MSGIAFSITGLANVVAAPFLGNKSDKIGYRRVLLIALLGASLMTLPQSFASSYWVFTAERVLTSLIWRTSLSIARHGLTQPQLCRLIHLTYVR